MLVVGCLVVLYTREILSVGLPLLVFYNMNADEEETKSMQAIDLPEQALELSFHPNRDVIASGLVNGKVCL